MGTTSHHASVLAIDTATNLCSVALVNDSDIKEIQRDLPRAHNQHILSMIDELLEGQSLSDAVSIIACGVGPGSFVASICTQGSGTFAALYELLHYELGTKTAPGSKNPECLL